MDPELKKWLRGVPVSKMAYPETFSDRLKYIVWRILGPIHPYVRNILGYLGYMKKYDKYRPNGRQKYALGMLSQGVSVRDLVTYLIDQGYGNHFVALKDEDELIGLRFCPDFAHQYHIRIFADGEVRAHYEYTTECHPLLHDREIGFEERRGEFLALLGGKIAPAQKAA